MKTYCVILENREQVEQMDPDFQRLSKYGHKNDVYAVLITSKSSGEYDYVYRAFAPVLGIDEDPGTGIAQCVIGHYWGSVLGKNRMKSGQLRARSKSVGPSLRKMIHAFMAGLALLVK